MNADRYDSFARLGKGTQRDAAAPPASIHSSSCLRFEHLIVFNTVFSFGWIETCNHVELPHEFNTINRCTSERFRRGGRAG
jgi:hypothetical protein